MYLQRRRESRGGGQRRRKAPHTKQAIVAQGSQFYGRRRVSPSQVCVEPFQSGFLAAELSSLSLLITSILWFLPGEQLRGEKQQMPFKPVLLETRSKQAAFVQLPGQARADAEEGWASSREGQLSPSALSPLPSPLRALKARKKGCAGMNTYTCPPLSPDGFTGRWEDGGQP